MAKTRFFLVKQVASLAQQLADAAVMQLSYPARNEVAGPNHAVLLFPREHMKAAYGEVIDWAIAMERVRYPLGLRRRSSPCRRLCARRSSEHR